MTRRPLEDAPQIEARTLADLSDWLAQNHRRDTGVWLIHHKKASPHYLAMGDIVDALLCWGWIDSLSRGKDDLRTMHYIAPRNPASNWSRVNKDKVARLMERGLMQPPGLRMVERAKESGAWTTLDDVENGVIPDDLQGALDGDGLGAQWDALPRSVRRAALENLLNTKGRATRARKVAQITDALTAGERPFQWVRKS